jgi:hypothetical protein
VGKFVLKSFCHKTTFSPFSASREEEEERRFNCVGIAAEGV